MTTKAEPKLLNIHGLARALHIPAAWLKAEATAGRIPCLKIGRRRLFNPAAVKAVLAQRAAEYPANNTKEQDQQRSNAIRRKGLNYEQQ